MKIHLYIDQLVLEGLTVGDRDIDTVQAAFEVELKQLLSNGMLTPNLRNRNVSACVPVQNINLVDAATPHDLGQHISWAVYRGLSR